MAKQVVSSKWQVVIKSLMKALVGFWSFLKCGNVAKMAVFGLVAFVGVGLLDPFALAHAEGDALKGLGEILALVINVILFISILAIDLTGSLFGTEYLTAPDIMVHGIQPMWVFVRNIVNIMFVLVILFIAMANLFTMGGQWGGGNWTIKDKLPKLIFAMIAVNFSLLGMKIVIDAVYVGTIVGFSISDTALNHKSAAEILTADLCVKKDKTDGITDRMTEAQCNALAGQTGLTKLSFMNISNKLLCGLGPGSVNNEGVLKSECSMGYFSQKKIDEVIKKGKEEGGTYLPGSNVMAAVATHFMHLEFLPMMIAKQGKIDDLFDMLNSTVFSVIMALAYGLSFVALGIAMLARMVFLWLIMVASPLLVVDLILGFPGFFTKHKDMIVNTIIMPVKAAAAFSISFVMIANLFSLEKLKGGTLGSDDRMITLGYSLEKFGATSGDILWQVATILIFWLAIWAAFENTVASSITNKFKSFGETAGKLALKGAGTIPALPLPGGKKGERVGVGTYMRAPELANEALNGMRTKDFNKMREAVGMGIGDAGKKFTEAGDRLIEAAKIQKNVADFGERARDMGLSVSALDDERVVKSLAQNITTGAKDNKAGGSLQTHGESIGKAMDKHAGRIAKAFTFGETEGLKEIEKVLDAETSMTGPQRKDFVNGFKGSSSGGSGDSRRIYDVGNMTVATGADAGTASNAHTMEISTIGSADPPQKIKVIKDAHPGGAGKKAFRIKGTDDIMAKNIVSDKDELKTEVKKLGIDLDKFDVNAKGDDVVLTEK